MENYRKIQINLSFSIKYLLIRLAIIGFTVFQYIYYVIPEITHFFGIVSEDITFINLAARMWPPIIGYGLIAVSIASVISIFKPLKSFDEYGLIIGLIAGLITGLIGGLIIGLIFGLIAGLIIGLIIGLIDGLIDGLITEFEE